MPSFTFESFDKTQIEYQTGSSGHYIQLYDPESLQKGLGDEPWENDHMITEGMKRKERKKRDSASGRLSKRLAELKYDEIPDKEPGIYVFRAKHKVQCFEARLDHAKRPFYNPSSKSGELKACRKKLRNVYIPELQAVLKDSRKTHSSLADSPEKGDLNKLLRQFEILKAKYEELSITYEPVAQGSSSGTSRPMPEPTSWQDKPKPEDVRFSQFTNEVYKESAGGLNDDENWVGQFVDPKA